MSWAEIPFFLLGLGGMTIVVIAAVIGLFWIGHKEPESPRIIRPYTEAELWESDPHNINK